LVKKLVFLKIVCMFAVRLSNAAIFCIKNLKLIKMIKINDVQYMTVHEYAKEKSITIQTVYNWIKDKQVETRKFMNMTLIKL